MNLARLFCVTVVMCGGASAPAQQVDRPPIVVEREGNITRGRVEGSLAPSRELGCISLHETQSTYTPPDLHTGIAKCFQTGAFGMAARLFILASGYARFDAERIKDRSAAAGGQVLILRSFAAFTGEQKEAFSHAARRLTGEPSELAALCSDIQKVGPPTYFPRYLILHGLNAFASSAPLEDALDPTFDSQATWSKLLAGLRCPRWP